MRQFSQRDLARKLRAAGFSEIAFQADPLERFGIIFEGPWGRPLVARKKQFARIGAAAPVPNPVPEPLAVPEPPPAGNPELEAQTSRHHHEKAALERRVAALESQLRIAADSRWLKLGRRLGFGPKLR
jgi:hypothetical protein